MEIPHGISRFRAYPESVIPARFSRGALAMSDNGAQPGLKTRTKTKTKTERPRLHKVILLNDDYTPREFVVRVLQGEFSLSEDQAYRVMVTAHRLGVCVVAVFA